MRLITIMGLMVACLDPADSEKENSEMGDTSEDLDTGDTTDTHAEYFFKENYTEYLKQKLQKQTN